MTAPLAPTSSAMPLPMFLLAPVTSATLPASSSAIVIPPQLPDCFTVTTFFGLQSNDVGFFGNTRVNFPPFTWNSEVHGVAFLAGMSLLASIPSASNEWMSFAAASQLARVRRVDAALS